MNRILVIDDDLALCELLVEYLIPEGFEVETVNDGEQGVEAALSEEYGLVVLDVMLPRMNGFDVLRHIREKSRIPVIMLTARGDDIDRIVGLEMGADDYLPKPFNPRELVARIRAIQRRAESSVDLPQQESAMGDLQIGDLVLKSRSREVFCRGGEKELTSVEFNLLEVLLRRAGQVISREDLVQQVLGRQLSPYDRSIDVHISALRKKLGPLPQGSERIKTVRGVGYLYTFSDQP
ncbi:MAG: response regulator transcription factor [Desulfuromonadales bacterium]|nr:response regulator transcription factor [Desulfuromonadales bacterium]